MATTKLKIRNDLVKKNGADSETTIYVQYCFEGKIKLFNTDKKVLPRNWDENACAVKKSDGYTVINSAITATKSKIDSIIREAEFRNIFPTLDYVEQQYEAKLQEKVTVQPEQDVFRLYEQFLLDTSSKRGKRTNAHYKVFANHLKAFEQTRKKKITLADLNTAFYHSFVKFLLEKKKMGNATVNNQLKRLKVFMSYLTDNGIHAFADQSKFTRLEQAETDIVYLSQDELTSIYQFDLTKTPRLERVRDMLVFACATGLRHSDFSRVRPENIKGHFLHVRTVKTKDPLKIPLNSYSAAILQKYGGKIPGLSQQKFNDYVKELGKMCGIEEPIEVTTYLQGIRLDKTVPKYELLSSHTGRRTFVTQSLDRGMSPKEVMAITGHRDIKTMMRYIALTDSGKVTSMNRAWGAPNS